MSLTYYVALPFVRSDDGTAPGQAMECQSEGQALSRAGAMSRDPANAGAIAFKRSGDPLLEISRTLSSSRDLAKCRKSSTSFDPRR
jgi:hypothetical protein